jgi:hypothetical protein
MMAPETRGVALADCATSDDVAAQNDIAAK